MKVGIIGYGSMGRMLLEKFSSSTEARAFHGGALFVSNRRTEKIPAAPDRYTVCGSNGELADRADSIFLCVRPADMKGVLDDIRPHLREDSILVSLNGSIPFSLLEEAGGRKIAKVIPSVTAEINRSQTLACFNSRMSEDDKKPIRAMLECMGSVIELPEDEMGMGSELVSCMPGFIASLFDVVCQSAQRHTSLAREQIVSMVLQTLCAAGDLMREKSMSFADVVSRVATKGGITEEGSKVIYESFPAVMDEVFAKTLEKRRLTADKAKESFNPQQQLS